MVEKITRLYCTLVRTVNNLMETDKRFRSYISDLEKKNGYTIIDFKV